MRRRRGDRDAATLAYRFDVDDEGRHQCDVRFVIDQGEVIDYTVLYLATIEGVVMPVERYDSAHGYPHRDSLDWDGHVIEKFWIPLEPLGSAASKAVADIKANWSTYFAGCSPGGHRDESNARRSS